MSSEILPIHATKRQQGSRGIAPLILDLGAIPRPLDPTEKPPVPIPRKQGGFKLNGRHHILVNADHVNLLDERINTTMQYHKPLIRKFSGSKHREVKSKLTFHHQNAG